MLETVVSITERTGSRVFLLGFAASYTAFIVSIQPARADLSCKYESGAPVCVSAGSVSDDLSDRMRKSRILFESKRCRVSEITLSGDAGWPPQSPFEVRIYLRYECESSQDESAQPTAVREKQISKYTATARYEFSCALRQYKFFASGFDIHNDGTRSHWDSQGSSREIPWQDLTVGSSDPHLTPLFRTWCD